MTEQPPRHTVVRISRHWHAKLFELAALMSRNVPEGGRPVTLGEAAQLAIAEALSTRGEAPAAPEIHQRDAQPEPLDRDKDEPQTGMNSHRYTLDGQRCSAWDILDRARREGWEPSSTDIQRDQGDWTPGAYRYLVDRGVKIITAEPVEPS